MIGQMLFVLSLRRCLKIVENLFPTRAADKARLDKASLYLTKLGHYVAKEVNQSYESEGKKAPFSGKYAIENFVFRS